MLLCLCSRNVVGWGSSCRLPGVVVAGKGKGLTEIWKKLTCHPRTKCTNDVPVLKVRTVHTVVGGKWKSASVEFPQNLKAPMKSRFYMTRVMRLANGNFYLDFTSFHVLHSSIKYLINNSFYGIFWTYLTHLRLKRIGTMLALIGIRDRIST